MERSNPNESIQKDCRCAVYCGDDGQCSFGQRMAVPSGITVQVNGQEVTFPDAEPESKNGRTFIPVRAAFEALGAEVTWDQADKSVTAVKGRHHCGHDAGQHQGRGNQRRPGTRAYDGCGALQQRRPYLCASAFCGRSVFRAVGWDGDEHTVMIVDVETLLATLRLTIWTVGFGQIWKEKYPTLQRLPGRWLWK